MQFRTLGSREPLLGLRVWRAAIVEMTKIRMHRRPNTATDQDLRDSPKLSLEFFALILYSIFAVLILYSIFAYPFGLRGYYTINRFGEGGFMGFILVSWLTQRVFLRFSGEL